MESARVLIVPEGMARIFLLTSQGATSPSNSSFLELLVFVSSISSEILLRSWSISLETLSLDELLSLVPLLQTEPTGFEEDM